MAFYRVPNQEFTRVMQSWTVKIFDKILDDLHVVFHIFACLTGPLQTNYWFSCCLLYRRPVLPLCSGYRDIIDLAGGFFNYILLNFGNHEIFWASTSNRTLGRRLQYTRVSWGVCRSVSLFLAFASTCFLHRNFLPFVKESFCKLNHI